MDKNNRKKELLAQYKEMKPPMGLFAIENSQNGRFALGVNKNIPGVFNSLRFQLQSGNCLKFPEVQKDWNQYGADAFRFVIVEELAYDEETPERDYSEDLALMLELALENLDDDKRKLLY